VDSISTRAQEEKRPGTFVPAQKEEEEDRSEENEDKNWTRGEGGGKGKKLVCIPRSGHKPPEKPGKSDA